jgi:hypothetical protein
MIVSVLIGLTLILSTFISTVSIVQKIAYAQARMEPSNNGVPAPNPMMPRSTVVGSNIGRDQETVVNVQGVPGAGAGAVSSDGRSITSGLQTFVQGAHSADVNKVATALHKIPIAGSAGTALLGGTGKTLGTVAGALSSDGRSITNGPQTTIPLPSIQRPPPPNGGIFNAITKLIVAISRVAGLLFIVGSIAKLYMWKQNPQQACNQLNTFLIQVNAKQTNGQLTAQQAAYLSQQANAIQLRIGCSNIGGML